MSGKRGPANKKIIIYAIIGVIAVSIVAATTLGSGGATMTPEELARESQQQTIEINKARFCGLESEDNSNSYVREYILPSECQMPLGITVDNERVWYVSTKQGTLGSYVIAEDRFEEYTIPSWPARLNPNPGVFSMTWDTKTDNAGNVWFTDDSQNLLWRFNKDAGSFDNFRFPGIGPISFDFDSDGNIYLVGVRSSSLYFGDISEMESGTSQGFTEIRLPLEAFSGFRDFSSGSVVVDRESNVVWTSVLAFGVKGQIYKYDATLNEITIYDLPQGLTSPVGITIDDEGKLWITDHGTSIFFMLDPDNGSITRHVTSILSSRVTGAPPSSSAYTLPYWIQTDFDGNIWFNQHVGNKISKFDPITQTMTEYWIPTQNRDWANCPEDALDCGVANALQFSIGPASQVWFTEWTENKIGMVRSDVSVPLSVSAPDEITVNRGDSTNIMIDVSSEIDLDVSLIASGTFTNTGMLGNSTGIFSQQSISLDAGSHKQVSYIFSPAATLAPGQYILMLGADRGDVAVLQAVKVNIV